MDHFQKTINFLAIFPRVYWRKFYGGIGQKIQVKSSHPMVVVIFLEIFTLAVGSIHELTLTQPV